MNCVLKPIAPAVTAISALLCLATLQAAAQFPAATAARTGSVTGHVICDDTQRPARFAEVYLLPRPQAAAEATPDAKKSGQTGGKMLQMVQGVTGLDGSFTLDNLPPGEYYVTALLPGYVVPVEAAEDARKTDGEGTSGDAERQIYTQILRDMPVVRVTPDRVATTSVTIRRGGVVAGKLLFDDGTPVEKMFVTIAPFSGSGPFQQSLGFQMGQGIQQITRSQHEMLTDDQGSFRFAGLRPGKYILQADMWTEVNQRMIGDEHSSTFEGRGMVRQRVVVYGPGTFFKSEAKPVEVRRGDDQVLDQNITVKLNGLHAVRGRVLGGDDHHPIDAGLVRLTLGDDFSRDVPLRPDGTFRFDFVPEGTFQLRLTYAADLDPGQEDYHVLHSYEDATEPVIVGEHDVTVDDLQVAEKKPAAPASAAAKE